MADADKKREAETPAEATGTEPKRQRKRASGWDKADASVVNAASAVGATTANGLLPSSVALANLNQQATLQQMMLQRQQALLQQQAATNALLQQQQAMQQNVMMRRVYVGSLQYELTEEHIRLPFSAFGVITKIDMPREPGTNRSKGFCFVEYATEESAQAAMRTMNGFMLAGRAIKVNLPTSLSQSAAQPPLLGAAMQFPGMAAGGLAGLSAGLLAANPMLAAMAKPAVLPTATPVATPAPVAASPKSNRLYVGCVYWDLTAEQLKAVFEAFGTVVSSTLIPDPETGKHKGYGFVEYKDEAAATAAIENMNGFELCNKILRVGYCHPSTQIPPHIVALSVPPPTPQQLAARAAAAASGQAPPTPQNDVLDNGGDSSGITSVEQEDNVKISGASQRQQLMQRLSRNMDQDRESRCIVLRNMVGVGEVDADLSDEVKEECGKFGVVNKVYVHETKTEVDIYGNQVTFLFEDDASAAKARASLDNRYFGGRTVSAAFYPRVKFESGIYM